MNHYTNDTEFIIYFICTSLHTMFLHCFMIVPYVHMS